MSRRRMETIAALIGDAERDGPLETLKGVEGLSGGAIIGTLQRLARSAGDAGDGDYMEVGVFRGYSLLSVAYALRNTRASAIGIDDFSQFDPDGSNRDVVESAIRRGGLSNVVLINMDYEDAFDSAKELYARKVAVFFVDGPHDYRSQLMCLLLARPLLTGGALVVVDDSNYRHVRQANRDFLRTHPEFALLFEAYTPAHPMNLPPQQLEQAKDGWWNGVNILVHDPERVLPRREPPTQRDRSVFVADHLIHASRCPGEAVSGLQIVAGLREKGLVRALLRLLRLWRRPATGERGSHPSMNTFSESLPPSRFHLPPDLDSTE
jgi:predicted O-methyltransferase YrrM